MCIYEFVSIILVLVIFFIVNFVFLFLFVIFLIVFDKWLFFNGFISKREIGFLF